MTPVTRLSPSWIHVFAFVRMLATPAGLADSPIWPKKLLSTGGLAPCVQIDPMNCGPSMGSLSVEAVFIKNRIPAFCALPSVAAHLSASFE